jgi:hypothetical protein
MTYVVGGLIQANDYNGFAGVGSSPNTNNVNKIWLGPTTPANTYGYGQTLALNASAPPIAQVYANTAMPSDMANSGVVFATQWNTLLDRISNIALHQGTTIASISPAPQAVGATTGLIRYFSALDSTIINNNIQLINDKRLNATAFGTSTPGNSSASWNSGGTGSPTNPTGTSPAPNVMARTINITWNITNAKYFFNAGGLINMSFSFSPSSSSPQNDSWVTLLNDVGTIYMSADSSTKTIGGSSWNGITKVGGGGNTPTITNQGYYNLSGAEVFRQYGTSSAYTTSYVAIQMAQSGDAITATVILNDDGHNGTYWYNQVDGTVNVTVAGIAPTLTGQLVASWGTPTFSFTYS